MDVWSTTNLILSEEKIISKCASVTKLFKVKEEQFENLEMPRNASFNRS